MDQQLGGLIGPRKDRPSKAQNWLGRAYLNSREALSNNHFVLNLASELLIGEGMSVRYSPLFFIVVTLLSAPCFADRAYDLEFLKSCYSLCTTIRLATPAKLDETMRKLESTPGSTLVKEALENLVTLKRSGAFDPALVENVMIQSTRYVVTSQGHSFPIAPLSALETAALTQYSGSDYKLVNQDLRSMNPTAETLVYAAYLNNALDKLPEYRGEVKRGIKPFFGWERHYPEGEIITERGFTSTTSNLGPGPYAESIEIRIESRTGRDISMLSSTPQEHEILFKAGTQFRVVQVVRPDRLVGARSEIKIRLQELVTR